MVTEDQTAVVDFLSAASTHDGTSVERIDTHTAIVFLAGTRAWKLKRAVRFDYLDFSTVERRKTMCEAEVRLNRRTAPSLYRGVVPIGRAPDGSLVLGGPEPAVEWLVEMERFDQSALLDRLAADGRLDLELMGPLALEIARFHLAAEHRRDHGGKPGMRWVVEGNAAGFAEQGAGILQPEAGRRLTDAACSEIERHGVLLDARRDKGCVRQCHGDLHLRNIVLLERHPTLFDAIEFNDEIACTDVLYDLAFLLMDLWRRRLPRHANAIWNGYLSETNDLEGVALLPLFLSCRAAVRAKTSATAARFQSDAARARELEELARDYLAMAERLLHPASPCLIAIGGLSGSGKSALAMALAPAIGAPPGALVLRSDEIRKRLCGVAPLERLGPEGYTPAMSARVYATVADRAGLALRSGHSVIVDAVHARADDRRAIERVAAGASVRFIGLWLDAPKPVLIGRTKERRSDPSDADESVIHMQAAQDTGPIDWHRLDASPTADLVLRNAQALLGECAQQPGVAFKEL
jgi:aminoglycoside phosphotransferase family enzyme/predicted kinase